MAEETNIGDDFVSSEDHRSDCDFKIFNLNRKIEALQDEHRELMDENWKIEDKIEKLTEEIGVLKNQKALLKFKIGRKESAINRLKEEKSTFEAVEENLVNSKTDLDEEYEWRMKELKRKVRVMEAMEIEENSKRIRIEEEEEANELKKKAEDLETLIMNKFMELEKMNKEKFIVELALGGSEKKVKDMELEISKLQSELEEAGKVISRLKGKMDKIGSGENGGLKLDWPAITGSMGVVISAAIVVCFFYGRRRS